MRLVSRPRKTVEVAEMAAKLQRAIVMPELDSERRGALCWALETLLLDSGNYKGFAYVGGFRPGEPDFDEYLRTYMGVRFDQAGTALDIVGAFG